jgi:CRP-like cAMP-binding protein
MDAKLHTGNLLLDSVTDDERSALLGGSRRRPIDVDRPWRTPGDTIEEVSFPISGTMSLIADAGDTYVEAATIGREGAADVFAAISSRVAPLTLIGQVRGEAVDVPIELFGNVYENGLTLGRLIQGYIEALFVQVSMSAACLAAHNVTPRCARWLLETHDRVDSDTFGLKQEFLAMMLGVHRPSVSIAAGALQAAGLIEYRRGRITILDREGLEKASCSCYEAVRSAYSHVVPLHAASAR